MRNIIFLLLLFVLFPASAHAKTAISVQPSVVYVNQASPSAHIVVRNSGDSEVTIEYTSLYLEPQSDGLLIPKVGSKERPQITRTDSTQDSSVLTIPAQSSVPLSFSIKKSQTTYVPGIMFFSQPHDIPADKTSTSLSGGIVVPILFKGNTHPYSLSVTHYKASSVVFSNSAEFTASVKNNTADIAELTGLLTIRNIMGNEVKRYEIPHTIVFGNQTRTLDTIQWEPKLLIGLYTTELQLKFGDGITTHKRFLIGLPVPFAIFLFFAGLIVSGICLRVVKYRK